MPIIRNTIKLKVIEVIRTLFKKKGQVPIQPFKSNRIGKIRIYKQYALGLQNITDFSHIILIYIFHKSKGHDLLVKSFLNSRLRGLFSTGYPRRPNQIGISVV